jgi:hypothetical protein
MELSQLNQLSALKSISIPPAEELVASRFEKWSPDSLAPWTYLASYHDLTPELQLRYNQLHALSINELFIWFEEKLLLPILSQMINNKDFDTDFKKACQFFYDEEVKHSEMFWRLSYASAPEMYKSSKFYFLNSRQSPAKFLMEQSLKFQQLLGLWCWVLIFFEERTLMFSKEYLKAKTDVSAAFARIHHLHMIEEARHVQMDEHFISRIYSQASPFTKKMTVLLFKQVLNSFASPKYMSLAIAERLKIEFIRPLDHDLIDQIISDLPQLKNSAKFQDQFFGPQATKETFSVLKLHPEFDRLHSYFKTTSRET